MTEEEKKQVADDDIEKIAQQILNKLIAYIWEEKGKEITEAYHHFLIYGDLSKVNELFKSECGI